MPTRLTYKRALLTNNNTNSFPVPTPIGTIKEFNGANFDSSNWQTNGTGISLNGTDITLVGSGTTNVFVTDKVYFTDLERWKYTWRFTAVDVTGASFGALFGIYSEVSTDRRGYFVQFCQDTSAAKGRLDLYFNIANFLGSSASNVSFTPGDYIEVTMERNYDVMTATASNLTTSSAVVTVSYTTNIYVYPSSGLKDVPNCGSAGIYTFGGTQIVDYFKMESQINKFESVLCAGDSRYQGFFSNTRLQRASNIVGAINTSGGSERARDLVVRIPELQILQPQTIVLSVFRNDLALGSFNAQAKADYDAYVQAGLALGSRVFHNVPPPENQSAGGIDVSSIVTYLIATYPANRIIGVPATWNATTDNEVNPEGSHWTASGNSKEAAEILATI